jgi:hypothetical protein
VATDLRTGKTAATPVARSTRRDELAVAFFGTWMIIGLFLDGWAHQSNKPESFFSPWHGVLYSGFAAAQLFYGWTAWRERRSVNVLQNISDRLMAVGFVVFSAGAFGDFIWHEIFGIEVDLETLLSPTHLSLMIGGLLMVTGPIRIAWRREDDAPSRRTFFPTLVCVTLATALASFFLMYASAFNNPPIFGLSDPNSDGGQQVGGIAMILVTTAVLMGAMLIVLRRWTPPFGSFTFMFGAVATLMSGLQAFDHAPLVVAALIGGLAADVLVHRRTSIRVTAITVPIVLWTAWFAVYAVVWGLGWTVELWTGSIILAAMTGLGLSVLCFPPAVPKSASAV